MNAPDALAAPAPHTPPPAAAPALRETTPQILPTPGAAADPGEIALLLAHEWCDSGYAWNPAPTTAAPEEAAS